MNFRLQFHFLYILCQKCFNFKQESVLIFQLLSRNENSFFPTDLKNEGVEQRVAMWHYQSWPDHGSPDDPLTFFEIIHSLKAKP